MQLGSIEKDFYVRAVDLARLLKATENEISRLVRSGASILPIGQCRRCSRDGGPGAAY